MGYQRRDTWGILGTKTSTVADTTLLTTTVAELSGLSIATTATTWEETSLWKATIQRWLPVVKIRWLRRIQRPTFVLKLVMILIIRLHFSHDFCKLLISNLSFHFT